MQPPVITLSSDFGLQSHLSAAVKGQLLQHCNTAPTIIDVSHTIDNYNLAQAAYFMQGALQNFGAGTYHCMYVNLYEQPLTKVLCFGYLNQYIFCPDNGFVKLLIGNANTAIYEIPLAPNIAATYINYTQTIASVINWLYSNNPIESIGNHINNYLVKQFSQPIITDSTLEGHIIFVDKYENVITNITQTLFTQVCAGRAIKIVFKRDEVIKKISQTYAAVNQGDKVALFNTVGYLQISINQGNAAGLFGLVSFENNNKSTANFYQRDLYYQTIKIFFEDVKPA